MKKSKSEKNKDAFSDNINQNITKKPIKKKKKKRMSVKKKVIILISIILTTIIGFCIFLWFYLFGGIRHREITEDNSKLGIDESFLSEVEDFGIVNVALFGVDSRQNKFEGLSDTIIIATIDSKKGKIKLTSIARDSYVSIDGYDDQKINAAYNKGGPELAIKTINQNFRLDIKNYVTINMGNMTKLIDAAGGVDIEISEDERIYANQSIGNYDQRIKKSGLVHLNGVQATAYMRVRHLDSDLYRMGRQQKVLEQLMIKAKQLNPIELANAVNTVSKMVETSLETSEILSYASIFANKNLTMETMKLPNSKSNYEGKTMGGYGSCLVYPLDLAKSHVYDFIYRDIKTE